MDRSVKAPSSRSEMSQEYREIAGVLSVALGVPALTEVAGLSMWLAPLFGGPEQDVPLANPVRLGWELFATNELVYSGQAWAALGSMAVTTALTVAGTAVGARWVCERCGERREQRRQRRSKPAATLPARRRTGRAKPPAAAVDAQARFMAGADELASLSAEAMSVKAEELKVRMPAGGGAPGISIGAPVGGHGMLYASWEDLHVDIWAPRQGKSSSRVIPALMEAVGPALATSNKRDIVDGTREHRASLGVVKVFDPQQVATEPCTWYWDPLDWVRGYGGHVSGVQERAKELAGHFAAGGDASSSDAFFEPEGEDLLAGLILAAAVSNKPITQVFRWITDQRNHEPIDLVEEAGYDLVAAALADQYNAPERQRAGIFSTAKKMAACLTLASITEWVTKGGEDDEREAFDVAAFVKSTDTLYLLSADKVSNAGPLVTAFAAAVADEGTREGERNGGRMPTPMLLVLDEAANIVKWRELPKQYSHFGSRGMVVMTVLQSWAQGVRCWGTEGMEALWGAANIKVLGPGLAASAFLREVSEQVGNHYELTTSTSTSYADKGGGRTRSTSTSRTTEPTLTVSDLAAMPRGRALLIASGYRPALIATVPWWERPYAEAVRSSLAKHDPAHADQRRTSATPDTTQPVAGRVALRVVPTEPDDDEQEKSA